MPPPPSSSNLYSDLYLDPNWDYFDRPDGTREWFYVGIRPANPRSPWDDPSQEIEKRLVILTRYALETGKTSGKPNYQPNLLKHDLQEDIDNQKKKDFENTGSGQLYDPMSDMNYDTERAMLDQLLWMYEEYMRNRAREGTPIKKPERDPTNPNKNEDKPFTKCKCVRSDSQNGRTVHISRDDGSTIPITEKIYDRNLGKFILNPELAFYGIKFNPEGSDPCCSTGAGRSKKLSILRGTSGVEGTFFQTDVLRMPQPFYVGEPGSPLHLEASLLAQKPKVRMFIPKKPKEPAPGFIYGGGILSGPIVKKDATDVYIEYITSFNRLLADIANFNITFPKNKGADPYELIEILNIILTLIASIRAKRSLFDDNGQFPISRDPSERRRIVDYLKQLDKMIIRVVSELWKLQDPKNIINDNPKIYKDQDAIDELNRIYTLLEESRRSWEEYLG